MTDVNRRKSPSFVRRALIALGAEPAEIPVRLIEKFHFHREQRGPKCAYEPVTDWDRRLHEYLGIPWPCASCAELSRFWNEATETLISAGIQVGPMSFGPWNDGDAGLVRAIWTLVRHLRAERIVETGVAHGFTSRFILQALERESAGHLWSIDLPPLNDELRREVGIAVPAHLAHRWTYIRGSSRRRLPELLSQLGQIDLFVHDSIHTEHNVRFELDQVWARLRPGGAVVIDDIDANWAFHSFHEAFSDHFHLVCEAEPLSPDHRRFNQKGLFGIFIKGPLTQVH